MPTFVLRKINGVYELVDKAEAYFGEVHAPSGPAIQSDLSPFKSPLEGHKMIDGRAHLREELKRNNCRLVDNTEWKPVYKNPSFALKRGLPLNGEKR